MVHLGVNAVAATQTALGIVPAGTGNDIARGLGLPVGDLPACIDLLVQHLTSQAAARPVDAVRCTRGPAGAVRGDERWFAGVLGAGFDAVVNERANGWRWPRGHLRYDLAIVRDLPVFTPRTYRLTLDGEQWATQAMLVAIGNGPSYGGGMRVCPDAIFDDGLMDVLVVAPMSRTRFMALYPRVYSGTHVSHPSVQVRRAASLRIECDGIVAYADGERLWPLPLHLDVVPHALHVLAPGRVPADNPTDTLAYPRPEAEGGAPTP